MRMNRNIFLLLVTALCFSVVLRAEDFSSLLQKAQNGDAKAQVQLGYNYEMGYDGAPKDMSKAIYWYRESANKGNATAQYNLGNLYRQGIGVTRNDEVAADWYRKAAAKGYVDAINWLGVLYQRGQGVPQDYKKAVEYYRQAADKGNFYGESNLAYMYKEGLGVVKDYDQAFYWYQKSVKQGYMNAQNWLGVLYQNGNGTTQDYEQAMYWYKKADEQGDMYAPGNIGFMYLNGNGVTKDISQAMYWFKRAADRGYEKAKNKYEELAASGYKPAQNTPSQPPLLSMVEGSLVFSSNSQTNHIEAGKASSIQFTIANNGKGPALNCEARTKIAGTTSGITVRTLALPKIEPGHTYTVNIPITADINIQNGKATFTVDVYEPNGWGIVPFDLTVATKAFDPPLLQVVDYNVASHSGKIRKMEPFTLTFNLQNTKYGDAQDVRVKVNLPANIFVMDGSAEVSFPLIKSSEAKQISLTLAANNNYPTTNIPVSIDIKEKYGKFAENKQLDIALNQTAGSSINIAAKEEPQPERKEIQLAMMTADVDRDIPKTSKKNSGTFVLIIANENYQSVAAVPFALNDGRIFRQYCEQTLGIPAKNIHMQANATGNQIKAQINWLQNIVEVFDNPEIIIYYAGHGIPDESSKTAYLLPVDGLSTDVSTGYKLDDLYATLGSMPASRITVFMDACFSGSKREEGMLASARGVALKAKTGVPKGNMVVFSAAQGNETAYPNREKQHGLFTYYLLKKLQETEGDVSLQDLGDYIITNVKQQSVLLNSKLQTPCVTPSATLDASWQNWKLK